MTQENGGGFDPARFLVSLKGKEYLEVKWRLVWLRQEHPSADIDTELFKHDDKEAIFKARIVLPDGGSATGWGSETRSDFGDYLEKAETKALGRALGALGFGTQFTKDFDLEDVAGDEHLVDTPVTRQRQPAPERPVAPQGGDLGTCPVHGVAWRAGNYGPFHPIQGGGLCDKRKLEKAATA